jgi:hypothetical protein
MRSEGRINSAASERAYRGTLDHHCDSTTAIRRTSAATT